MTSDNENAANSFQFHIILDKLTSLQSSHMAISLLPYGSFPTGLVKLKKKYPGFRG